MTLLLPDFTPDRAQPVVAAAGSAPLTLGMSLLRDGLVPPHAMVTALADHARQRGRLADLLLRRGLLGEGPLYAALARYWQIGLADLQRTPPDARLIDLFGARECLRDGVLPWRQVGDAVVVAVADPADFLKHRQRLERVFGRVIPAIAPPARLAEAVLAARGRSLALRAELRVPQHESCRDWEGGASRGLARWAVALLFLFVLFPRPMLTALLIWAVLTLTLTALLKLAALVATLRPQPPEPDNPPVIARLPVVSVMVAMYREADIAPRLVRRLSKLDYPRELLDILLVVESHDHVTRNALARADLPGWMRVVVAPEGRVKTKPRALNYALDHCRGSIVGIYDAEDAPEPDQIRKVVNRFHRRGPDVACLQGVLDFYNPRTNWLATCFTIEYASWFRVVLPGLERLGLPIPLGGTTLFFRRDALEKLGGWDAHNVTEDADLGMRLARHGYRTELIPTTTMEEANCRALPWVKQRSRWVKGYMMTYASHMRDPVLLWRQLGAWQFAGFQLLFLGSLSQILLVPLLWSLWLLAFGLPHPLSGVMSGQVGVALTALFLSSEALGIAVGLTGLRRSGHKINSMWVPTLHLYYPLGALASYKAAWELVRKPFYWDKTSHGHFDQPPD